MLIRYYRWIGWFFLIPFYSLSLNAQTPIVKDAGAPLAPVQQAGRVYNGEAVVISRALLLDAAAPQLPQAEPETPAPRRAPPVPSLCDVGFTQRRANILLGIFLLAAVLGVSRRRQRLV